MNQCAAILLVVTRMRSVPPLVLQAGHVGEVGTLDQHVARADGLPRSRRRRGRRSCLRGGLLCYRAATRSPRRGDFFPEQRNLQILAFLWAWVFGGGLRLARKGTAPWCCRGRRRSRGGRRGSRRGFMPARAARCQVRRLEAARGALQASKSGHEFERTRGCPRAPHEAKVRQDNRDLETVLTRRTQLDGFISEPSASLSPDSEGIGRWLGEGRAPPCRSALSSPSGS